VPEGYAPDRPAGFVLVLHGSGGSGRKALGRIERTVIDEQAIALAVKSAGHTWDTGFDDDVPTIERLMADVFDTYAIDRGRVGVQGFSDGASYTLSLGLANGDLFRHAVASSPGSYAEAPPRGRPRIFITHGRQDPVIPFDLTSEETVPELRRDGYEVTFRPFDGGHGMPNAMVPEMLDWLGPG
jgi:phospholipase/carboxylesterase